MLNKNSKIMLAAMVAYCKARHTTGVDTDDIKDALLKNHFPFYQLRPTIEYLHKNGSIEKIHQYYDSRDRAYVTLSLRGLNYSEFNRIDNIEFLKKSIIVPILVSLITTTFALWLKGVLGF